MDKPIINPATLSEEQREAIRNKYAEVKEIPLVLGNSEIFAGDEAMFEWLFGSEFFKKGE